MSGEVYFDLQDAFVQSKGEPVLLGSDVVVQGDRWKLDGPAVVEIRVISEPVRPDDFVRLSYKKKGKIGLSDGSFVRVLEMRDQHDLPRWARHPVDPRGEELLVYNAYTVIQAGEKRTESWTGNAGMIVEEITSARRRYFCSNGRGGFNKHDFKFEIAILPAGTAWLPQEIY